MADLGALRAILQQAGYTRDLVREGEASPGEELWLTGYGQLPPIPRNACVAATTGVDLDAITRVMDRSGAPLVLTLEDDEIGVWNSEQEGPRRALSLTFGKIDARARAILDPQSVHRAKTMGRFDRTYQMELVDVGLLPRIERAQRQHLQRLLERIVAELRHPEDEFSPEQGHQILTIAFWILAARILQDHDVAGFRNLAPNGRGILNAVAKHYGGAIPSLAGGKAWRRRIDVAAKVAWDFGMSLREIGPEAISHVYESSLIARQTRRDLGTHSTPPFIVDYILGRLRTEILRIPQSRRVVVEPACGHGAFLVAALRVLVENLAPDVARHSYLQQRLRGLEIDHAAKEMARLSLTIADIPNPDGWDLREGDMFEGSALADLGRGGTVLLANAPFEDFSPEERQHLESISSASPLTNKTAEMLRRVLPPLEPDAVVGVVVPRQILHGRGEAELRRSIIDGFQLLEICVLPDRVFRLADHECAIILARAVEGGTKRGSTVVYRRVREHELEAFRATASVSDEDAVPGAVFLDSSDSSFLIPELRRLWHARAWLRLCDVATVQQGLSYHGWVRGSGHETIRLTRFRQSALGLAGPGKSKKCSIFEDVPHVYMDVNPDHIRRTIGGLPCGHPQVVLNVHPHSRGPWRLKAHIDRVGAALDSTRIAVRPLAKSTSVELLWAICNSPIANAYVYSHMGKRDIATGHFQQLPIPNLTAKLGREIQLLVHELFKLAADDNVSKLATTLRQLDALLLGAYGLFAPSEQRLCALFHGYERLGLPFTMDTLGEPGRLPLYLELPKLTPFLPGDALETKLSNVADFDAEINDGRRELAALRRSKREDPRVAERILYVHSMLGHLESLAAQRWIPDDA